MDVPPPPSVPPAPPADTAEGPREPLTWEDRVAVGSSLIVLLGAVLPWYDGQAWFRPSFEAMIGAALACGALLVIGVLRGSRNEGTRRQANGVLGLGAAILAGYVMVMYYRFHAATDPRVGVVGHLTYLGIGLDATFIGALGLLWSSFRATRPDPIVGPVPPPADTFLPSWKRWAVPLVVFLFAFSVYNHDVEKPSIIDFDEAHYVRVALNLTDGVIIDPAWGEPRPFNFEHPPVGKYFIALGYKLMGEPHDELAWPAYNELCNSDNPECEKDAYGWRFGSVLVGSLGVLGIYWAGLRLFRSMAAGVSAAVLLLADNLYFLHARTAMLDIFAVAFVLLGVGTFLGPTRRHRYFGAVFFGLGVASKHYALFVVPVFALLAFLTSPHTDRFVRFRDMVLFTFLVPFAAYIAAYTPYLFVWLRLALTTDLAPRAPLVYAFGIVCVLGGLLLALGSRRLQVGIGGTVLGIGLALTVTTENVLGLAPLAAIPAALGAVWALGRWSGRPRSLPTVAVLLIIPAAACWLVLGPTLGLTAPREALEDMLVPIDQFVFNHQEGFRWTYRAEVDKPHPYVSQPWTWVPMRRPVLYFLCYEPAQAGACTSAGGALPLVAHIYALGNPFTWWIGSFAVLFATFAGVIGWWLRSPRLGMRAFWSWLARPFSFHPEAARLLAALLFLSAYLPFFLLKRDPFNFYFLIAAPFFSLVLAGFVGWSWAGNAPRRILALAFVIAAVAVFVFYHPVTAGTYITESEFQYVMRALRCPRPEPDSFWPSLEVCTQQ